MPPQKIQTIKLIWQNGVGFTMETKLDETPWITIIDVDENGEIPELWENIQKVCEKYFIRKITDIGNEMKEV